MVTMKALLSSWLSAPTLILLLLVAISPTQASLLNNVSTNQTGFNVTNTTASQNVSAAAAPDPWLKADPGSCFVLPVTVGKETYFNVSTNSTQKYPAIDPTYGAPTGSYLSRVMTENGTNVRTFRFQALHGQEGYTFKVCFMAMTSSSSSSSPPNYCPSGLITSLPSSGTAQELTQKFPFVSDSAPFCVYLYVYTMEIRVHLDSAQAIHDELDVAKGCLVNKYVDVGLQCSFDFGISYVQSIVQDFSQLQYLPTYMNHSYGDYKLSFSASNLPSSCPRCRTPSRALPLSVQQCGQPSSPAECCGNGVCEGAETSLTCPGDCSKSQPTISFERVNETFSRFTFQPNIYTQGRRLLLCLDPVLQDVAYQQYLIDSVIVDGSRTCDNRICFIVYVTPCRYCLSSITTFQKISWTIFNDHDWVKFYNYNPQIPDPDKLYRNSDHEINTGVTYQIQAGDDLLLIAGEKFLVFAHLL
eukprot:753637-Hanusia_phi.AAC.4